MFRRLRSGLLKSASGRVLEVAGGTGWNLGHYPAGVDMVIIDLSRADRQGVAGAGLRNLRSWTLSILLLGWVVRYGCAHSGRALFLILLRPWAKCGASAVEAVVSYYWSMAGATVPASLHGRIAGRPNMPPVWIAGETGNRWRTCAGPG